jgi:NAD(P)-dependent dehydrogenase (short-subunit alcohol dehydrogenase family)
VAPRAAVARAAQEIRGESGDPGILVHCAARQQMRPFADLSIDQWRAIMRVNVDGAFHQLQAFLPAMRAAGWGRVVLVTSSTLFAPPPGVVAYVTSKGALQGLTRALAVEANVPESHFAAVLAGQAQLVDGGESFTEGHLDAYRARDYAPARINK